MSSEVSFKELAGASGITGAVVAVAYLLYKLCTKKKFQSKCCGNEMNIQNQDSVHTAPPVIVNVPTPTPVAGTPVQTQPNPKEEPTGLAV